MWVNKLIKKKIREKDARKEESWCLNDYYGNIFTNKLIIKKQKFSSGLDKDFDLIILAVDILPISTFWKWTNVCVLLI